MAATALLKFTQNTVGTGGNGIALSGVLGQLVTVSNSDNTGVLSWQIDLVYVDEDSSINPATPYAFNDSGSTPTATFTPDVRRSFRFVLKVWGVTNRTGTPDIDIRNFTVPELNGIIIPPVQIWPLTLPDPASGDPKAKPNELNFSGQAGGWAGQGNDGLLNNTLSKLLVTSQKERWVEASTTVPFAQQNGSRHTPYQAISQALNDVGLGATDSNWVIHVAPGGYNETLTVPFQRSVTLLGEDYSTTSINMTSGDTITWAITGACYLSIKNIRSFKVSAVEPGSASPNTGTLYLDDASLEYLEGEQRPIDVVGIGPNTHISSVLTTGRFAVDGIDYVANVTCGYFAAYDTLILGPNLHITGDVSMVSCQIDPGVTISLDGYSQSLHVDAMTYYWLEASSTDVLNGVPILMDRAYTYPGKEVVESSHEVNFLDTHKTLWTVNAGQVDITFPTHESEPRIPIGAVIYFKQDYFGFYNFVTGDVAVTTRTSRQSSGVGAVVQAIKVKANEWAISGDLIPAHDTYPFTSTPNTIGMVNIGCLTTVSHTSATTVTVPSASSVPFPNGTRMDFVQTGVGQVIFAGVDGSVTILSAETLKLRKQYSTASLTKLFSNTWLLTGDLELT